MTDNNIFLSALLGGCIAGCIVGLAFIILFGMLADETISNAVNLANNMTLSCSKEPMLNASTIQLGEDTYYCVLSEFKNAGDKKISLPQEGINK